ncbi:MAG TPA: DMT family transporter [Trebonia sp.]|nr:DMT family transporter [Trebonia sp.]
MRLALTVVLSLAAAAVFGLTSVLEQRNTHEVPVRGALAPRLLYDLLRRKSFVAAFALNLVGNILQVLALHLGSLAVVQPLIVLNLLFAVLIASFTIAHHPPDRTLFGGAVCCCAGVGWFLAAARPGGGSAVIGTGPAVPLGLGLAAALAACLAAAHWGPVAARPLWIALACGVDFGVNAFLLKIVPNMLSHGFSPPQRQWPLYMLVPVAPLAFLLNQSAFQAGTLIAPVLAVIVTTDPLVSILLGHVLLHESLASSPFAIGSEVAALALMTAGIFALAHRAPHVVQQQSAQDPATGGGQAPL